MLADNLSLYGGHLLAGELSLATFVKIVQDKGNSVRICTEFPAALTPQIIIKHSSSGKPGAIIDRHLISLIRNQVVGSATYPHVVNLTMGIPRADGNETNYTMGLLRYLTHLLAIEDEDSQSAIPAATAFVNAIARGES